MAQYNVGLPFLKTSFNPVSRQANRKTASTAFVNAVMREMFDERIGRDKDIEHSETANNEWLIANKEFNEIYENINTGEITTISYTPGIETTRTISDEDKLIKRDLFTADEYVNSVKKIVDDNNERLKAHGKRKLRKDCVSCVAGIVKVPMEIVNQDGFDSSKFYKDSLEVLKKLCNDEFRCGEINAAVIHRDEYIDKDQNLKSDHLHYNIIPYCWEEGKDGKKFKSLNGKKFLNKTFFTIINKNYPKMMRERGWEVADCTITEELETKKEQKQHQEQASGKDAIHYKAQAEREKERLIIENKRLNEENVKLGGINARMNIQNENLEFDKKYLQEQVETLEFKLKKREKEIEEIERRFEIVQDKIEETQEVVKEIENFETSTSANWLVNLINDIKSWINKYRKDYKEEPESIELTLEEFNLLEKALEPFLRLKEKVQDLVNELTAVDQLIKNANVIKQNKKNKPIKTKQKKKSEIEI